MGSNINVLIVDDNVHMLRILAALVRSMGFGSVITTQDPVEALDIFRAQTVDLILLDLDMPVLDGFEFTELVRNSHDSPNPFVPIIVVTAHSRRSSVARARDKGVTEFCAKPITGATLHARIASVVNTPRPFVHAQQYFGPDRRRLRDRDYHGPERREDVKRKKMS